MWWHIIDYLSFFKHFFKKTLALAFVFVHGPLHINALIQTNERVCFWGCLCERLMMSSLCRQCRHYAVAFVWGPVTSHMVREEGQKSFARITFSDVRGNAREIRSGLLRTALQIPGLKPTAIAWAPKEERRKQRLEIWSLRYGLFVTQA